MASTRHSNYSGPTRVRPGRVLRALTWLAPLLLGCNWGYVETGDLAAIREQGTLRVIVPPMPRAERLPRAGHPAVLERDLAEEFAASLDLDVRFVNVRARDEFMSALVDGRGDLIAAGLTVTPDREVLIEFSDPLHFIREQVVTRLDDTTLASVVDLAGRTIALRRSSAYVSTAEALARDHPELSLEFVSERLDTEEILYRVQQGRYDLTIADDNLIDQARGYMPELRVAFDAGPERPVAFGIRSGSPDLRAALNDFLAEADLDTRWMTRYTEDLPGIRERGVLRVLTRNSAATYFIWRGALMGFEYDLARRFAEELGVRLQVVVPPTRADLLPWLEQGYGDVVAAGVTVTPERSARGVRFSRPYNYVREMIVARADESGLERPEDLAGRSIVVRRRSSYWTTAEQLQATGIDVDLVAAPESLETETVIGLVASGEYDLTIADSHILDIELTWRDDVRAMFALGDSVAHGWAMRNEDTHLGDAADRFIRSEYRGLWFNLTYNKYFRTEHRILERISTLPSRTGRISPWDGLFQEHAERMGFDWRLIAAQAYEESRFDPTARSPMGAVGIMQLMPETARGLGVDDPEDPVSGIQAGTRYLRDQYELFDDVATDEDRLWFALASYNAGYGHVTDGRRLAARLGHDPNVWFGEVEAVMPLLARAEYHRTTRYGYCRCSEPVRYVRRIRDKFDAYRNIVEANER